MLSLLSSFGLVFLLGTSAVHGHEKHEEHDHTAGRFFCEGGGYNMYCGEGHKLKIDDAWFGRFADDDHNCLDNKNSTGTLPALLKDCGGPAMEDMSQFCDDLDNGCTLEVRAAKIRGDNASPCPDGVPQYLYLEFRCESILAGSGSVALKSDFVVYLMLSFLLFVISFGRKG